jgi:hypothetical protein
MKEEEFLTPKLRECLEDCQETAEFCLGTLRRCLSLGGAFTESSLLTDLSVCAGLCQTTAAAILLGSSQQVAIRAACGDACGACASTCEARKEHFLRDCAAVCRACAETCRDDDVSAA